VTNIISPQQGWEEISILTDQGSVAEPVVSPLVNINLPIV